MLIARWNIDVRFGQKSNFTSAMKKWSEEVGNKVGLSQDKLRVTTGSIGVNAAGGAFITPAFFIFFSS